jgi:hypothetical protein
MRHALSLRHQTTKTACGLSLQAVFFDTTWRCGPSDWPLPLDNRTNDVSQTLRGMVRNGSLNIQVNNNNMGGDPAPGADKVLTVIYRTQGREQTATVKEGNALRIP